MALSLSHWTPRQLSFSAAWAGMSLAQDADAYEASVAATGELLREDAQIPNVETISFAALERLCGNRALAAEVERLLAAHPDRAEPRLSALVRRRAYAAPLPWPPS